jgi:hypothetical protein
MIRRLLQNGLSTIEVVVSISIFTLISVVLVTSIIFVYRVNAFNIEQAFAVSSGRKGVEQMVRDLREVTYSDDGSYPIIAMGSTTVSFYSDIDRDDNIERVRFYLNGLTFNKEISEAVGTPPTYPINPDQILNLSEHVQNDIEGEPIFHFFDSNGVEILDYTNVSNVVYIRVNLIVNINPTRLPNEFTIRSSAALRNLIMLND